MLALSAYFEAKARVNVAKRRHILLCILEFNFASNFQFEGLHFVNKDQNWCTLMALTDYVVIIVRNFMG
jgi:hypothetical protein